jgi:NDP-sugar pyrophosphorylase family protein
VGADGLAVVVLAAGEGRRLAPLSTLVPKALCPVANRALLDHALDRVEALRAQGTAVAVNLHHGAGAVRSHLADRTWVHLSEERPEALGTAGALGALRPWIDGRDVLVVNADTWAPGGLAPFVAAWDRARPCVLVHGSATFGPRSRVAGSLLPWAEVEVLEPVPTGLYEVVWRRRAEEGALVVARHDGPFVDCATPTDLLEANLAAAALAGGAPVVDPTAEVAAGRVLGRSVVGPGAVVRGTVDDSLLWPGAVVAEGEVLVRSVRTGTGLTLGPLPGGRVAPA